MKLLIVTIPAQNEEKTIAQVVEGVPKHLIGPNGEDIAVEVLVVDDSSEDRTAELAKNAGASVLTVHGRPGLGRIFRRGMEWALRHGANYIVNIDGDGQFNPADIPKLLEPLLNDEADFVSCSRFKDPALRPVMPPVKYWGNQVVTRIINSICGGTKFTDVSCGFRAFNREAACRLTLFGRYTYTQECFIDLFSKGMRFAEVPLKVRGVREHGKSRVAGSIIKYASNSLPIIIRAMRDIQPLKFFGGMALALFTPGVLSGLFVAGWYFYTMIFENRPRTSPYTSLIVISGVTVTLSVLLGVLALLADMMGRHRKISEELLYLARRRVYGSRRTVRVHVPNEPTTPRLQATIADQIINSPSLHDSWAAPAIRSPR